jgi:peptide/nickel transport system substrate-binding protein
MKFNILYFIKNASIPKKKEILRAIKTFTLSQKIVFFFFLSLFFASFIEIFASTTLKTIQEPIPVTGGTFREGIVGSPRFINPVLSLSNSDKDLELLVFSGLTRKTVEGSIVLDLAENFSASEDNTVYIFNIDSNARFHDGTQVTARDVVFTVQQIQNPEIKSPKRVIWEGVSVTEIDQKTVRFELSQPFIGFLENTTLGILPAHIWENIPSEEFSFSPLNTNPVGSGPYRIKNIRQNKNGGISYVTLKKTKLYSGPQPYIKNIILRFFEDETQALRAFKANDVDMLSGISPKNTKDLPRDTLLYTTELNRKFGIFFNQNTPGLSENLVRRAISLSLDRGEIIEKSLNGFGVAINNPTPIHKEILDANTERAEALLDQAGWVKNSEGTRQKQGRELKFILSTPEIPELTQAAHEIKRQLKEIGIIIVVENFSIQELNQNVVRPRNFEIILFGQTLNQEPDIFAFWHGSQITDPGLNISQYSNTTVDTSLEELVQTFDRNERNRIYTNIVEQLQTDIPAVFLYSPQLIYIVRGNTLQNIQLGNIANGSERFLDIRTRFKETNYTLTFLLP